MIVENDPLFTFRVVIFALDALIIFPVIVENCSVELVVIVEITVNVFADVSLVVNNVLVVIVLITIPLTLIVLPDNVENVITFPRNDGVVNVDA